MCDVSDNVVASSEPQEYTVDLSGVLTCTAVFSGPECNSQPESQRPRLGMMLAGSPIDYERAPLNYTCQQPMHYLMRVSVAPVSVSLEGVGGAALQMRVAVPGTVTF